MSWLSVVMLCLAGFFGGGAWSFRRQQRRGAFWVMVVLSALCLVAGILWARSPQ